MLKECVIFIEIAIAIKFLQKLKLNRVYMSISFLAGWKPAGVEPRIFFKYCS